MSQKKADLLLASIAMVWGSSNLLLKIGAADMGTFNLIALRFCIAFVVTAAVFHRQLRHPDKKALAYGAALGAIIFAIFVALVAALRISTVSEVGFLNSTSVVMVPLLCAAGQRKCPSRNVLAAMVIVLVGLLLMNLEHGLRFSSGALLCLLSALLNSCAIILMDYASKRVDSTVQLGIFQVGFSGVFALAASLLLESPTMPRTRLEWVAVLGLALLCTAYGFILRPVAQKYTTPEHVGFLFSLEPVFSAIFGFLFLRERLHPITYLGAALVLLSVPVANELPPFRNLFQARRP